MFSNLISAALITVLAGRAMAFNVSILPSNTVYQASEVLSLTYTPVLDSCQTQCAAAQATINACAVTDSACLCSNGTTIPLQECETCMFNAIVAANVPAPDLRAGSNQVLAGWTANCAAAKLTVTPALGLTVPPTWDGPFVSVFPTIGGWLVAVTGGVLGSSLIFMLCNM